MTTSLVLTGIDYTDGFIETSLYASTSLAIFGYGFTTTRVSLTNLVNNTGLVSTDTTGVGTARNALAAASFGGDRAIFGYGVLGATTNSSLSNLVSNTGVVSADVTGVGSTRMNLAAASYSS